LLAIAPPRDFLGGANGGAVAIMPAQRAVDQCDKEQERAKKKDDLETHGVPPSLAGSPTSIPLRCGRSSMNAR
jgi:hypothetical protein